MREREGLPVELAEISGYVSLAGKNLKSWIVIKAIDTSASIISRFDKQYLREDAYERKGRELSSAGGGKLCGCRTVRCYTMGNSSMSV